MTGGPDAREQLVEDAFTRGRLPGLVAGTTVDGRVTWSCERGETGSSYRVASITKTFTAVALMQLRDEGRLDLDDTLGQHVPGAPFTDATLRRLLAHASGMTAEPAGLWWERIPGGSWDELVAANANAERVFRPGERYHYSNLGYALLGQLVARLRGADWWAVVSERIVQPVGLRGTTFGRPQDAAVGTSRNPLTGELVREPSEDEGAMAPAGQLWSTLDDLGRWADALVQGYPGVLDADTAVEMRTVQSGDPDTQYRGGYGLGLRLRWAPASTIVGHTGSLPGFLAGMFVDSVSRVGAVVLTNATVGLDPEGICTALIGAAQPDDDDQPPAPDPTSRASDLRGPWYWGNTAMELVPTLEGFTLVIGQSRTRFRREAPDTFRGLNGYLAGERLDVHRREDGAPGHLLSATFLFTRSPYDPDTPIPGRMPEPFGG